MVHVSALGVVGAIVGLTNARSAKSSLPVVDLGYELHQAIAFNVCAFLWLHRSS